MKAFFYLFFISMFIFSCGENENQTQQLPDRTEAVFEESEERSNDISENTAEDFSSSNVKELAADFDIQLSCDRGVGVDYYVHIHQTGFGEASSLESIREQVSTAWNPQSTEHSDFGFRNLWQNLNFCSYAVSSLMKERSFSCRNFVRKTNTEISLTLLNDAGQTLNCTIQNYAIGENGRVLLQSREVSIAPDQWMYYDFQLYVDELKELYFSVG